MLNFTDNQVKNMSKDTILLPTVINEPATGLIAQKAAVVTVSENLQKTDEGQKVFSDFYTDVCNTYHAELALLNNTQRTNYNPADIETGGHGTGPHFPSTPPWIKFPPKLIDSVVGLPITTLSNIIDPSYSQKINDLISTLKNGYNDNVYDYDANIVGSTFVSANNGAIAVGNKVTVFGVSSGFFIGRVTNMNTVTTIIDQQSGETSSTTTITFELLYGTQFSGAARVQSFLLGFNNNQRTGLASTYPNTSLFNSLIALMDSAVTEWKTFITSLKVMVDSNGDIPPRKAHNQTASANHQTALNSITTWQALPGVVVGGRFSDAGLQPLSDMITTRTTQTTNRIAELITDLGNVTQAADGSYTLSGVYGELFKTIDMRIAKGAGTLSAANSTLLGLAFFDKRIASANDQLTQYTNTFVVKKITEDTEVGQTDLKLDSITDLSVSDSVKIVDNESVVYNRTISAILANNTIRVNTGIVTSLTTGNLARVVKQK